MSITTKLGVVEIIIKGSKGEKGDVSSITVINNLTSNSTTEPLAAAQGTVLKNLNDTLESRVDALELGGSTIDQTARDSAASAQATADNNEAAILNNILEINSIDTRLTTEENKEVVDATARTDIASNVLEINSIDTRLTTEENKEVVDATARADIASNDLEIGNIDTRLTSLENAPVGDIALNDLTDVNTIASDNQVLTYNEETGEWNAEYSTTALGITQFSYKMQLPSTTIPDPKFLSKDVEDPSLVTMLYINKNDDAGETDLTLFLENIRTGDWLNIFDKQDASNFEAYDVIGDVVLNGDIFEVPVVTYESTSTITADTKIRLFWRRYSYNLDLENLDQRVTDAESAIINNTLEINSIDLRVDALELDNTAIDQTARDAAAAAQSTADINTGDISSLDTRLTNEENKAIIDSTARSSAAAADLKAEATNDRLNDLGEFTGTIITDNSSLETALQDLETSLENVAGGGSIDSIARQGVSDNTDSIDLLDTRVDVLESNSGGGTITEKYVLSAKDLTKECYVSLKSDAYILASEAPILAGIVGNKENITPMKGGTLTETEGNMAEYNGAAAYKMGQFYNSKSTSGRSVIYDLDLSTSVTTTKIDNKKIISYLGDDKMIVVNDLTATGINIYSFDKDTTDINVFLDSIVVHKSLPNYIADSFGNAGYDPLNNTVYNNDYSVFLAQTGFTLNVLNHNDMLNWTSGDTYKTIPLLDLGISSSYLSSTKLMPILTRNNNLFLSSEGSDIVYIINLESEEIISHKLKEVPALYCRPSFNGQGDSYYIHNRVDGVTVYDTDNFNILYEREGEYLGMYAEIDGNIIKTSNVNNSRIGTVKSFDQITINETTTTFTELGFTDLLGFTFTSSSNEYKGSARANNEAFRDGYMILQRQSSNPIECQVLELNKIVSDYIKLNAEKSAGDKSWYVFKE